jgi:hypothetical protein
MAGLLATFPYWNGFDNIQDECYGVFGAQRLLQGQWPYLNWTCHHTPGHYLLSALWFGLVGIDKFTIRALMAITASLQGLVIFGLAGRVLKGPLVYLPWVLWSCGGISQSSVLSYHWTASLFASFTALLCIRWVESGSARSAATAGAAAALTAWTLQSEGLATLLMLGVITLRFRPGRYGFVALGFGLGSLVLWLPFLTNLSTVYYQAITQALSVAGTNRFPYSWSPLLQGWSQLVQVPLLSQPVTGLAAWSLFLHNVLRYGCFHLIYLLALIVSERKRERPAQTLAWCGLCWMLVSFSRASFSYLAYLSPLTYCLASYLVSRLPRATWLACLWSLLEVSGFFARSLVWQQAQVYPIPTRIGTYWTENQGVQLSQQQIYQWCQGFLPPGSQALGYPYCPSLYVLFQLRNPLSEPILNPLLYPDSTIEEASRQLASAGVTYVLVQRLNPEEMANEFSTTVELFQARSTRQEAIVLRGYRLIQGDPGLGLYRRIGDPTAPR